jgi:DNA-binding NtrC family response regulator
MARVLVVDDEPSYRKYLEQYLTHEGHEVRAAGGSSEALRIAAEFEPEVLLADWMLKDRLHGLDIGLALRAADANLPILLMTGYASAELREQASAAGVFRFLEKPFGLEEIAAAIADAIGSRSR